MTVAAIILAAGQSSRFEDGHKLLAAIDGIPIVRRVCSALAASNVGETILVTADRDGAVAAAAGAGRWRIVGNPDARDGLSTSLRVGLENIGRDVDGALIALGDMPGITTGLANELLAAFDSHRSAIVFPLASNGRRGHPVIWPKHLFATLAAMRGDSGGKSLLAEHKELWLPVPCDDEGAFADIDTRDDLQAFTDDQAMRRK
ncbi:MAG: nucleotidyltransferase family protein [Hyphomicrobium sp.]|uniref:nucleotidyltransferase family protein n=1 Tax=Hyphomicrobium sp. TaxID=82 RepID=UPI0039E23B13